MDLYARQLARYLELFPPEQIKVYLYDYWRADPEGMIADLFRFLGLDDGFVPDMSVRHRVGGIPRSTGLRRAMERETSLIRHLARAMIRCGRESKRRSIAGMQYVRRCRTTCDGS